MCYTHRRLLSMLVLNLIQDGKKDKAAQVLAKCEKELPAYNIPHDYQGGSLDLARGYVLTGDMKKAQQLIDGLWLKSSQYIQFYCSLDGTRFTNAQRDVMLHAYIMQQILDLEDTFDEKKADKMDQQLTALMKIFQSKGGSFE
jgi:hypothetical protein